ncbi:hypothetical protein G8O24_18485 [Bradyrhizobium sp. INPA01-394B]|uniref:O-antigen/teichoic acid export membrane protein n=1 Tax=Bradyrhizobium campsiandrae TaxID=1729892 RepID=A0ABR7U9J1_9BRAD|nr:hypothetical protein [Bradyrhizobium campsiandrae]MBC9879331.1 hypothetical protein [Bradyrhizobium campsiandrae]MBC9980739.1 hypothetical protein [Bradyrhizobium campsiandrae]
MRRQIVAETGAGTERLSADVVRRDDARSAGRRSQRVRLINVVLLVGGYGLGQGAIFVVQTWLVARGAFELLSSFGTLFSFAMLSIFLIDAGSTTTLARRIAGLADDDASDEEIWPVFWATVVVRGGIALALATGAIVYALGFAADLFSRYYLMSIIPGLAVWTCNAVGMLDGRRLSGVSGITGSLAFATSALALVLAVNMPPPVAGGILGSAFSLGYVLTVAAQWVALKRVGQRIRFRRPGLSGVRQAFLDGAALVSQFVPGQLILRAQLVMSTVYLGAESTALFVYAKQAVVATTMLVGFIMRVDFPGLVQKLKQEESPGLRTLCEAQKLAIATAIFFAAAMFVVGMAAPLIPQDNLARAAELLMAYAPTIVIISMVTIMMQGTAAMGDYVAGAKAIAISTLVGTIASYAAIGWFGIYALLAGEVTGHGLSLALLYVHLRQRKAR